MAPGEFNKTWKKLEPNGSLCNSTCEITIKVDGDTHKTTVTCNNGHRYNQATYHPEPERISDGTYTITLRRGKPNVITCTNAPLDERVTGSWTADDSSNPADE